MSIRADTLFARFLDFEPPAHTTPGVRFIVRRMGKETKQGVDIPNEKDLDAVVRLSHDDQRIREANIHLTPEKRRTLYYDWWVANNNAFWLLEKHEHGRATVIGNTCMLPLSDDGVKHILNSTENNNLVLTLRKPLICPDPSPFSALLFDTWVIREKYQRPHRHQGYGYANVLKHLSEFFDDQTINSARLIVDPSNATMKSQLCEMRFKPMENERFIELDYNRCIHDLPAQEGHYLERMRTKVLEYKARDLSQI